jgi:hypothetical protein
VGRDLDQVALFDVPGTAQPGAAQTADVEDEGEAALDLLRPQLEGDLVSFPGGEGVDGCVKLP